MNDQSESRILKFGMIFTHFKVEVSIVTHLNAKEATSSEFLIFNWKIILKPIAVSYELNIGMYPITPSIPEIGQKCEGQLWFVGS